MGESDERRRADRLELQLPIQGRVGKGDFLDLEVAGQQFWRHANQEFRLRVYQTRIRYAGKRSEIRDMNFRQARVGSAGIRWNILDWMGI